MLACELVPCGGHFLDDGISRNEMMFGESEVAGSFVGVEVDDSDARAWFERRLEVAEVFCPVLKMMDSVADEEEIDGCKRQLGVIRLRKDELGRVGGKIGRAHV